MLRRVVGMLFPEMAKGAKAYPTELVGEQHYPGARMCREGDRVWLRLEPENPHDPRAVAALRSDGAMIGYLPRDSWLQRVIHDERKGVACRVMQVVPSAKITQIVLSAAVCDSSDGENCVLGSAASSPN